MTSDDKCYLMTDAALEAEELAGSKCGFSKNRDTWGLCQYQECETVTRKTCLFPFK